MKTDVGFMRPDSPAQLSGRRRLLLGLGSALALPVLPARAQTSPLHRVAFLSGNARSDMEPYFSSFRDALLARGYSEGQNLLLDARFADYSASKATDLVKEVAALRPAVLVVSGSAIAPAYRLSPSIPVVFLQSGDPVDGGFADSFAQPGRHATGVTLMALDLIIKRLEFLKEIDPGLRRVALLGSPEHAGQRRELAASQDAASRLGIAVSYHEARNPLELAKATAEVAAERPGAALLFSDGFMTAQRKSLAAFFMKHRIPSAAGWSAFPESGHLLSYGPERNAAWKRLAYYVDRILKGAQPGDLPIELPTVVELVVNRRTADAMDLSLPAAIRARADRIVDAPVAL